MCLRNHNTKECDEYSVFVITASVGKARLSAQADDTLTK